MLVDKSDDERLSSKFIRQYVDWWQTSPWAGNPKYTFGWLDTMEPGPRSLARSWHLRDEEMRTIIAVKDIESDTVVHNPVIYDGTNFKDVTDGFMEKLEAGSVLPVSAHWNNPTNFKNVEFMRKKLPEF